MKRSKRNSNINVRSELATKQMLIKISEKLNITQADTVEIALEMMFNVLDGEIYNHYRLDDILSAYRDM